MSDTVTWASIYKECKHKKTDLTVDRLQTLFIETFLAFHPTFYFNNRTNQLVDFFWEWKILQTNVKAFKVVFKNICNNALSQIIQIDKLLLKNISSGALLQIFHSENYIYI
jgi:hypothetical protein